MLTGCGTPAVDLLSFDGSKKVTLVVEVADSPAERERGLMERQDLAPDTGMLFAFTEPQTLAFWMKNTTIPLGIMFFDRDGQFISAAKMEPCKEEPCTRYVSPALAQYAIEVAPDFREKHGIGVGWKLDLRTVRRISRPT